MPTDLLWVQEKEKSHDFCKFKTFVKICGHEKLAKAVLLKLKWKTIKNLLLPDDKETQLNQSAIKAY